MYTVSLFVIADKIFLRYAVFGKSVGYQPQSDILRNCADKCLRLDRYYSTSKNADTKLI